MNEALRTLLVKVQALNAQDEGQDLVEYALLVGLISVALVATLNGLAGAANNVLVSITGTLANS